jgi:hypothetical protein
MGSFQVETLSNASGPPKAGRLTYSWPNGKNFVLGSGLGSRYGAQWTRRQAGSRSYIAFRNRYWWFQPWDLYSLSLDFVNRLDLLNRSLNLDQSFGQRRTQADQFWHRLSQRPSHEPQQILGCAEL